MPGAGSSRVPFEATIARYAPEHEVTLATLAGFAGRPPSHGPLLARAREAIAEHVIREDARGLTIVGHSLGGWLALALALDEPERIAEVVLVDAVPAFAALAMPSATAEQIEAVVAEREARGLARGEGPAEFVAHALAPMITGAEDRSAVIGEAVRSDGPTLVRVMSELWRSDLRSELSRVTASVTLAVPLPLDMEPTLRAARLDLYRTQLTGLPASRIEIVEPSRHFIMLDQPSRFFMIVDDALRRAHRR